jgi:uncharacterized protein YndB with AHSA1/START domain
MSDDRIEKQILLRAEQRRAWKALTDAREFGSWFGLKLDGPFAAGAKVRGVCVPTTADPEIAKMQKAYEGAPVELVVDRVEPERLFSFRWHPFAVDPAVDYSGEPMTLIAFTLEAAPGGVRLTVVESGFDALPAARRAAALKANEGGWSLQLELIQKYLAQGA